MAVSYPTRASITVCGVQLSPIMALLLLALRQLQRESGGVCCADPLVMRKAFRRWLASNLTFSEWRLKGWTVAKSRVWYLRTMKQLFSAGLVHSEAGNMYHLTDRGIAVAEACRPLFSPAMRGADFAAYCDSTYSRVSGRFAV